MTRSTHLHENHRGGFTLIELMVVVVILAVLSGVAVIAYRTYVKRARVSEVSGLLSNIKGLQESYRSEFGFYCSVNTPDPNGEPVTAHDPGGAAWAGVNARWAELGFAPDSMLTVRLNTIAGLPNQNALAGWTAGANRVDLSVPDNVFTSDHWFVARAFGDQDNDGNFAVFWVTNLGTGVSYRREVE